MFVVLFLVTLLVHCASAQSAPCSLQCCGCGCCAAAQQGQCTVMVTRAFCLPNTTSCRDVCADHTGVAGNPCNPPPQGSFDVLSCKSCYDTHSQWPLNKPPAAPPQAVEEKPPVAVEHEPVLDRRQATCALFCCPCQCCDEGENGACWAHRVLPVCAAKSNDCARACANFIGSDGNLCTPPSAPGYGITACDQCN